MSTTIDVHAAGSADALPTIMVESNRLFAFGYKLFIQDVEHFKEGHLGRDILYLVCLEAAFGFKVLLFPDSLYSAP
jgi:hypothetical protein